MPEMEVRGTPPECARVDAAEQEKRCRLTIDRVRWPPDENARI
jgi:hypothetical protein